MAPKKKPRKTNYSEPSRPTVKHLFAVSGNRCAFKGCKTPVIDRETRSVLCQICHIKGENNGAARFDEKQTPRDRQAFDNLILMCGKHHKIIDDNPAKYQAEALFARKAEHEQGNAPQEISKSDVERLLQTINGNVLNDGSILAPTAQRGGQVAHKIINKYGSKSRGQDEIVLEAQMTIQEGPKGSPGISVLVVCRSRRPAKIASANLSIEGTGFVAIYQKGWEKSFNYTPVEGMEKETLSVKLLSRDKRVLLNRDDAARFFFPLSGLRVAPFLSSSPDALSIRVTFIDGRERILIKGKPVYDMLKALADGFGNRDYPELGVTISIQANSKTGPSADQPTGEYNSKPIHDPKVVPKKVAPISVELGVGETSRGKWIICGRLTNEGRGTYKDPRVSFVVYPRNIGKTPVATEYDAAHPRSPFQPADNLDFRFGFDVMAEIIRHAQNLPSHRYAIIVRDKKKLLAGINGSDVLEALKLLNKLKRERRDQEAARIKHEHPSLSDAAMTIVGFHQLLDGEPGHATQIIGKSPLLPDLATVNAAYKELIDEGIVMAAKGFIKDTPHDGGPASYFTAYRLTPPADAASADGT